MDRARTSSAKSFDSRPVSIEGGSTYEIVTKYYQKGYETAVLPISAKPETASKVMSGGAQQNTKKMVKPWRNDP